MVAEGKLAAKMGLWLESDLDKLINLIKKAGLPTEIPENMKSDQIIDAMKLDKKSRSGQIEMVLPNKIGDMSQVDGSYGIKIEDPIIEKVL
jgi:3-dehydroquinate synthase